MSTAERVRMSLTIYGCGGRVTLRVMAVTWLRSKGLLRCACRRAGVCTRQPPNGSTCATVTDERLRLWPTTPEGDRRGVVAGRGVCAPHLRDQAQRQNAAAKVAQDLGSRLVDHHCPNHGWG